MAISDTLDRTYALDRGFRRLRREKRLPAAFHDRAITCRGPAVRTEDVCYSGQMRHLPRCLVGAGRTGSA